MFALTGLPLRNNKNDYFVNVDLNEEKFFIRGLGESHVYGVLKMMSNSDGLLHSYLVKSQKFLRSHPRTTKTTFLSENFWKKILRIVREYIAEIIVGEIDQNGGKFAIEIDSTTDVALKHQVSIVVKYVIEFEGQGFTAIERTVVFKPIKCTTAKNFFDFLKTSLHSIGLDLKNLTGTIHIFVFPHFIVFFLSL